MRTPTWGEIEQFLVPDGGWEPTEGKKHVFYEKTLPDGRVLNTHVSHDRDRSMSPRTFSLICRTQLEVTRDEFWRTIREGKSVRSGATGPVPPKPPSLAMLRELQRELHLTEAKLAGVTFDEAKRRLDEFHSRPKR